MWEVAFALALWHSGDSAVWERSGAKTRGDADLAMGSITSGGAHDRDAADAFDPISAIPGGEAVEPIEQLSERALTTVQRSITVTEAVERAPSNRVSCAPAKKPFWGRNNVMSRISKQLISRL